MWAVLGVSEVIKKTVERLRMLLNRLFIDCPETVLTKLNFIGGKRYFLSDLFAKAFSYGKDYKNPR